MHPVRSTVVALLLVFVTVVAAVAAPIAYRSYRAYQDVFVTQVPDQGSNIFAEFNPEGTPVIVTADEGEDVVEIPEWDGDSRLTLLLLGVDRRPDDYSRSDTIILVNIDPAAKSARMLSIPRDLLVIVPGFGAHKINAAYAFGDVNKEDVPGGGPGLMMRTIETNFGINIDYFAEVDFNGFVDVIDTVGGLTLDVPYPLRDNEYPGPNNQYMRIYFPSGWQHMEGDRVLQYARTRHADNDIQRSARQQQVLLALRQQAINLDLIWQAPTLIEKVGDSVRTDLSRDQAMQLAGLATEIDAASIEQMSIDAALYENTTPEYYFTADWGVIGDIMTAFTGETVVPPMSALANPRYDTGIQLLDGSVIPGLGPRVVEVLVANGFEDVTTAELPDYGNYPETQIITTPADLNTAFLLAQLLGLPESAILISEEIQTPTVDAVSTSSDSSPAIAGTPGAGGDELEIQPLFPTAEPDDGLSGTEEPPGVIIIRMGDDMPDPQWYWAEPVSP